MGTSWSDLGSRTAGLALLLLASGCGSGDTTAPPPGDGVGLELVTSGLQLPVLVTAPLTDLSRIFVVEKRGVVRVVRNGSLLPTPFLDIRGRVSTGAEQGLLGLTFHPDYAANGVFVVSYTDLAGDSRVVSMRVSPNPDVADPAREHLILAVDQPFANHNGGHVTFGPFGYLYIGLGDGGSAGDPGNRAQDRLQLFGKLLRYSVDAEGQARIPSGNPLVGQPDARWDIWSLGLRNPWRFSFDRLTGDLYVADVGQDRLEEVTVRSAGGGGGRGVNFGWATMEGSQCFRPAGDCNKAGLIPPTIEYSHAEGCSVVGGHVYRGSAVPALTGLYLYSDYCSAWVRSFRFVNSQAVETRDWPDLAPGAPVTSFGEDAAGELYLTTADGRVHRIVAR